MRAAAGAGNQADTADAVIRPVAVTVRKTAVAHPPPTARGYGDLGRQPRSIQRAKVIFSSIVNGATPLPGGGIIVPV